MGMTHFQIKQNICLILLKIILKNEEIIFKIRKGSTLSKYFI